MTKVVVGLSEMNSCRCKKAVSFPMILYHYNQSDTVEFCQQKPHLVTRPSHRTRHIREVTSQLNVPTSLTPANSHLLCFYFLGCVKEVSNLIKHRVVSHFGTRVGGTGANMIAKSINSKVFAITG